MRYKLKEAGERGVQFKLEQGTSTELYDHITHLLKNFYIGRDVTLNLPSAPVLPKDRTGQINLSPISLNKGGLDYGQIGLNYFRSARNKRDFNPEEDYPVFQRVRQITTYESLSILFNTKPSDESLKKLAELSNGTSQKEIMLELQGMERDIFLSNLANGHLDGIVRRLE